MSSPEAQARQNIDRALQEWDWVVHCYKEKTRDEAAAQSSHRLTAVSEAHEQLPVWRTPA